MSRHTTLSTALLLFICLKVAITARADGRSRMVPISTSICDVSATPEFFDGKIVSLRATVVSGFEVFAIRSTDEDCDGMWLEYREGGATTSTSVEVRREPRAPVTVLNDRNFKRFQSLLNAEMHPRTNFVVCVECHRYEVSAIMVGRVDYAGQQMGYGHMNAYKLKFDLMSVSDVAAK